MKAINRALRCLGEATPSHHAQAAQFIGSLDNVLGEMAEGSLAAAPSCLTCHSAG